MDNSALLNVSKMTPQPQLQKAPTTVNLPGIGQPTNPNVIKQNFSNIQTAQILTAAKTNFNSPSLVEQAQLMNQLNQGSITLADLNSMTNGMNPMPNLSAGPQTMVQQPLPQPQPMTPLMTPSTRKVEWPD